LNKFVHIAPNPGLDKSRFLNVDKNKEYDKKKKDFYFEIIKSGVK
jgi:hypothetical protein